MTVMTWPFVHWNDKCATLTFRTLEHSNSSIHPSFSFGSVHLCRALTHLAAVKDHATAVHTILSAPFVASTGFDMNCGCMLCVVSAQNCTTFTLMAHVFTSSREPALFRCFRVHVSRFICKHWIMRIRETICWFVDFRCAPSFGAFANNFDGGCASSVSSSEFSWSILDKYYIYLNLRFHALIFIAHCSVFIFTRVNFHAIWTIPRATRLSLYIC